MSTKWPEVTLDEHCDLLSGFAFKSPQFTDDPGDVPLIKGKNVGKGEILWDKSKRWPVTDSNAYDRFWLREGDVVLAMDRPIVGGELKFAWIKPHDPPSLLVQRVARLRGANEISTQFVRCLIASPQFKSYIDTIITGVNVPHISGRDIKRFSFRLPDPHTQERIVDVLSSYDGLIENNRRRIALLEEAAQQLYKEWFVRLRFPGHAHTRITNGVPDGWDELTLKDVCEQPGGIQTGPFGSQLHQSDYTPEGTPVVMPKNIINARIVLEGIARVPDAICDKLPRHNMERGDIVYGRRGDIGRHALIGRRQIGWMCGTGCIRLRPVPKEIAPRFLFDQLGRPEMITLITSRATGGTMLNLNGKIMSGIPIVRPPDDLQLDYVGRVEPMYALIESLGEQNQKLAEARDLLLPRLMSGEVEV